MVGGCPRGSLPDSARYPPCGGTLRGTVRIWCGPLILGELPVATPVMPLDPRSTTTFVAQVADPPINRYRKIFPSYSHLDRDMVEYFAEAARALGDQYLQDVLSIRTGERWEDRLPELIDEADIFQLFWSSNSMRSIHCRREWELALALERPSFVRPIYWEDPLPADPPHGLPPDALRAVHFTHIPPLADRRPAEGRAEPRAPGVWS